MANCRINPGVVESRPGTTAVFASTGAVAGIFNWVTPGGDPMVLYKDGDNIKRYRQNGGNIATLLAGLNGAVEPSFADLDVWVYFAAYDAMDNGTIQARIYDGVNTDKAFRGPITLTTASAVDGGAGFATAGTHYFGFVYQNRTGYAGIPTTKVDFPITASANVSYAVTATSTVAFAVTATNNGTPDVVAAPGHTFVNGDQVTGAGATGDTAINGTFLVANAIAGVSVELTDLQGTPIDGNGVYSGGGTLTRYATPDVVSAPGHTFINGEPVTGAGATGDTAINGIFLVANAVAGVSVELTDLQGNPVNGNGVYAGGGTLRAPDFVTAPGNNLATGNTVSIAGATGDLALNGKRIVFVITPGNTFVITDTNGNPVNHSGAYTGGGVLTVPLQITLTENLRQVNISVTIPAQTDGGTDAGGDVQATLFLIATRADNPANWYFIPDDSQTGQVGEQPVPYNTPTTLNFIFSISDEDMAASLDSANQNFLFLAQDGAGLGPFNPNFVSAYGLRMVYGNGTVAYASDQNNPQQIAADRNQIMMPNQRHIALAFQLPNSTDLYLTGDRWTARVTDNNDSPSTWPEPIKVSDTLGAPFAACVCYKTGANNAWIATESGVYYFDGTYADIPLTYLISDVWKTVNWSQAQLFEIQDDVANLKLYVSVALYPSLVPTTIICFDYQNGKRYDQVDISIDSFHSKPTIGSIGVVKEFFTDISNLWIGPSAAGNVVRFDSTTHNDEGVLIDTFWVSNLFLGTGEMTSQMIRVSAADVWVRGNGALLFVWRGPDNQALVTSQLMSAQGVIVTLSPTPGLTYQTKLDFTHIENFTFGLGTAAVDEWFSMSGFRPYFKPDLYNR